MNSLEMLKEMQTKLIDTIEVIEGFRNEHKKTHGDQAERALQKQQLESVETMLKQASKTQKKQFQ